MDATERGFPLYDEESAPAGSRATLAETQRSFGMIPNLEAVMAGAPALLEGYGTLWDLAGKTSFSAADTQIVFQTVNVFHGCDY